MDVETTFSIKTETLKGKRNEEGISKSLLFKTYIFSDIRNKKQLLKSSLKKIINHCYRRKTVNIFVQIGQR